MRFLSTAAAARAAGTNRMHVHRLLKSGRLAWHGRIRRGPAAAGIDLHELRAALRARGRGGSCVARVQKFIAGYGYEWPQVIAQFAVAMSKPEMCFDFASYCLGRLVARDSVFLVHVMDGSARPQTFDAWTAGRLVSMADRAAVSRTAHELRRKRVSFAAAWRGLVRMLRRLDVRAHPVLVFDVAAGKADLRAAPLWPDERPASLRRVPVGVPGVLSSAAPLRRARKFVSTMNRLALDVAEMQFGPDGQQRVTQPYSDQRVFEVYAAAVQAILDGYFSAGVKALADLGIERGAARLYASELQRLAGYGVKRSRTRALRESDRQEDDAGPRGPRRGKPISDAGRVTARMVGVALQVSRFAAAAWLRA